MWGMRVGRALLLQSGAFTAPTSFGLHTQAYNVSSAGFRAGGWDVQLPGGLAGLRARHARWQVGRGRVLAGDDRALLIFLECPTLFQRLQG